MKIGMRVVPWIVGRLDVTFLGRRCDCLLRLKVFNKAKNFRHPLMILDLLRRYVLNVGKIFGFSRR
jgi:hypothetical protein